MGKLKIIQTGLYTSIQDGGRFGFRRYGVPVSGAMDLHHFHLANLLVGNKPNHPGLEITQIGPKIHFDSSATISICGADLSPVINDIPVSTNKRIHIPADSILTFGEPQKGIRAYLGIYGFEAPISMKSHSMYSGITKEATISKDSILNYKTTSESEDNASHIKTQEDFFSNTVIDVAPGPEFGLIKTSIESITDKTIQILINNRMGYQLEAFPALAHERNIITAPVLPGTVQLTPQGQMIILMRDAQTTGGYPRIFQVSEESINRLAQKTTGQVITFKLQSPL